MNHQEQLFENIEEGNLEKVQILLKSGIDVNFNDALTEAVRYKHKKIIKLLIDKGADVNYREPFGHTPLMTALDNGSLGIVKMLIKNGANINFKSRMGCRINLLNDTCDSSNSGTDLEKTSSLSSAVGSCNTTEVPF